MNASSGITHSQWSVWTDENYYEEIDWTTNLRKGTTYNIFPDKITFKRIKNGDERIYSISARIGEGVEGEVFRISPEKGKSKIVKIVPDYMRELDFLDTIKGKNIEGIELPYKENLVLDDFFYLKISSEYTCDLDSIVENKTLSPKDAETAIRQLIHGLMYLEENEFVHLDIKLNNVFFRKKEEQIRCDLSDFGRHVDLKYDLDESVKNLRIMEDRREFKLQLMKPIIVSVGREHFSDEFLNIIDSLFKDPEYTAKNLYEAISKMAILKS